MTNQGDVAPDAKAGAAAELLRRRRMRRSLEAWCVHCGYVPARHHRLILEYLERVARGKTRRLAIFCPPGSAKSTYASVLFPPWVIAQGRPVSIIAASHTAELAERWGRRVRNLLFEHGATLGTVIRQDSHAAGRWETLSGSEYYAAGVGGSITGRRADLAIIDDPVRSREDAESEIVRRRHREWWLYDLETRLKPDASVVLIQTRWHEDDLAGWLLRTQADQWTVLSLPMIATSANDPLGRAIGEPLWPEWYSDEMIADARRDPRVWSALYQQEPMPDTGELFRAEWFRAGRLPDGIIFHGASDFAVTAGGGDHTVHIVGGLDASGRLWIADLWRGQADSGRSVDALLDLVERWRPLRWAGERGQIESGLGPFIAVRMRERGVHVARELFATGSRGKVQRASTVMGIGSHSGIWLPDGAPWAADLISECLRFPAGKHDDQVDALALLGQTVSQMSRATLTKATPQQPSLRGNDDVVLL